MQSSAWVNPDLDQCLCWDDAGVPCENVWDQCDNYFNDLVPLVVPAVVAAVLLALLCAGYVLARVCSCMLCCASVAFCCWKAPVRDTQQARVLHKSMFVVAVAYSVFATAGSIYFSSAVAPQLREGDTVATRERSNMIHNLNDFTTWSETLAHQLLHNTTTEVHHLLAAPSDILRSWNSDVSDVQSSTKYLWVVDATWWALWIAFVLLCVTSIMSVHRVLPEVFFLTLFVISNVIVAFHATLAVSGGFAGDVCDDFGNVADRVDSILQSKYACGTEEGSLGGFLQTVPILTASYGQAAGNASTGGVAVLCRDTFDCSTFGPDSSLDVFSAVLHNTSTLRGSSGSCIGCSIAECAVNCDPDSSLQTDAATALHLFQQVSSETPRLSDLAVVLSNCTLFKNIFAESREPLCEGRKALADSVPVYSHVTTACMMMAVFMLLCNAMSSYVFVTKSFREEEANSRLLRCEHPLVVTYGSSSGVCPPEKLPAPMPLCLNEPQRAEVLSSSESSK